MKPPLRHLVMQDILDALRWIGIETVVVKTPIKGRYMHCVYRPCIYMKTDPTQDEMQKYLTRLRSLKGFIGALRHIQAARKRPPT